MWSQISETMPIPASDPGFVQHLRRDLALQIDMFRFIDLRKRAETQSPLQPIVAELLAAPISHLLSS